MADAGMEQRQTMEMAFAVEQLQQDVTTLDVDVQLLKRQVQGGDDPTKGLIVLVSDMTKAVGNLTLVVTDLQKQQREYEKEQREHDARPHLSAGQLFWRDVGKSAVSSLTTMIAVAILVWIVIGLRISLLTPVVSP